jgi:hypothetical protein
MPLTDSYPAPLNAPLAHPPAVTAFGSLLFLVLVGVTSLLVLGKHEISASGGYNDIPDSGGLGRNLNESGMELETKSSTGQYRDL